MNHFDLAIIGTGSGNSIPGKDTAGMSIAICEDRVFGGTCINVGCVPSKMFVYPATVAVSAASEGPRLGVDSRVDRVRVGDIRDRVFGRIDPIAEAGERYRRDVDPATTFFRGTASFVGERALRVGDGTTITADQVVIATGSSVVVPEIDGLADSGFLTNETIMRLPAAPAHLIVLGAGYIAAEMAHVYSGFGSEITTVARSGAFLRSHDADVSRVFTQAASRRWNVLLHTTPIRVRRSGDTVTVDLDGPAGASSVSGDALLVATGRAPATARLACETGGIGLHPDGRVVVDEYQRTTAAGVWALGDVSSPYMLKHVANAEARTVAHNITHPGDLRATDHRYVPHAVFTHPQIASVGATEAQLSDDGVDYVAKIHRYADVAYGWAMADEVGFCKVLADRRTGRLLGAHILGAEASILIQPLIQAMSFGVGAREMARGQYWIHPALAEVVENALLGLDLP